MSWALTIRSGLPLDDWVDTMIGMGQIYRMSWWLTIRSDLPDELVVDLSGMG